MQMNLANNKNVVYMVTVMTGEIIEDSVSMSALVG